MSRSKNAIRNIFWGSINKIITILLPFVSRTMLLYKLGTEYIGLNSLFTSILGLLSLSELGIGSALIFSMYEPIAKKDTEKVCSLLNLYKKCYRIIGIIVLLIGLSLIPFLKYFIAGEHPSDINIIVLYFIYLSNTVLSYWLFSYKKSILIVNQRVDIQSNINTFVIGIQSILQIFLLFLYSNYYIYLIVLPVLTVVENIIISVIVDKKYPNYVPKGKINFKILKEIKKKIIGLLFQRLGVVVLGSVDSIVISTFLGLSVLGIYNNYYYVITALISLVSIFQTALKPIIGNSIVLESKENNLRNFQIINFMYLWIITWCTCTLLCLYEPFMSLWAKENAVYELPMIATLCIYFFVYKWGDMLFVYQEAAGIWWETRFIPLVASIVNLIINIIMVKKFGIIGIPISTIISVVLIYDYGYAKILFKMYFGSVHLKSFILKDFEYLFVALISCVSSYYLCHFINVNLYLKMILNFIICLIIPNIFIIGLLHRTKVFKDTKEFLLVKLKRVVFNEKNG